ncbi:MAG: DNA-3-methyladenine glycosylase I [Candidatus Bathyarchaeia archaeon]|jgi:DNA-3-methyladenine glycosylase I
MNVKLKRCWNTNNPLYIRYHDEEWGVPVHEDNKLFEFLVLDCFQAGLSWLIILKKRDAFRKAFDNFDPEKVAKYTEKDVERLLEDSKIVRNRNKILATINNARCFLEVQKEFGCFDAYIWQFVNGRTIQNSFVQLSDLPAESGESKAMSRDLKKRGFQFVGPTICYAFMQAAGLVNDHLVTCFRYNQIKNVAKIKSAK